MSPRERLMLLAVVGLAAFFLGQRLYRNLVVEPMAKVEAQIAEVTRAIGQYQEDLAYEPLLVEYMERLRRASLPFDGQLAQSQYQTYLHGKMAQFNLQRYSVSPAGTPSMDKRRQYMLVPFSVQAEGDWPDVVRFLVSLYSDPLLQQVESLQLVPSGPPERRQMSLRLSLTGLAVAGTPARPRLIDESAESPGPRLRLTPAQYEAVVARDIFRPYQEPAAGVVVTAAASQPAAGPRRPESPDQYMKLTALLDDRDPNVEFHEAAWLHDTRNDQRIELHPGDPVAGGRLVAIQHDRWRIVVRIGGQLYAFELGDPMSKREPLPPEEARGFP